MTVDCNVGGPSPALSKRKSPEKEMASERDVKRNRGQEKEAPRDEMS